MNKTLVEPISKNEPSGKNIRDTETFIVLKESYNRLYFHIEDNNIQRETKSLISHIHNTCEQIITNTCKDLELFKFIITTYTIYKQSKGYRFVIQQIYLLIVNLWPSFFPDKQDSMYINKRIGILSDIDKTYRYLNEFTVVVEHKKYKLIDILRYKNHPKLSYLFVKHTEELRNILEDIYSIYYTVIETEKIINQHINEHNKLFSDDIELFEFERIKKNCNQLCNLLEFILQKIDKYNKSVNSSQQQNDTTPQQKEANTSNDSPLCAHSIIIDNINKEIEKLSKHSQYTMLYKTLKYCMTHINYTDSEIANKMVNDDELVLMLKLVLKTV